MKYSILIFLITITACSATKNINRKEASTAIADGKLFASAFQQTAAEYRALCYQAYNTARWKLDQYLLQSHSKPIAIITDIDETVLDNSAYEVQQVLAGKDYESESWYEWTSKGMADTVPGAPSFLQYASSRGVTIFYITNRNEEERAGTLKNLKKFNLPNADNAHLILRTGISSKETRREDVMKDFNIAMLIGDNLADFSSMFDKKTRDERNLAARNLANEFGNRFIIIPNTVYGDWESSLYMYNNNLSLLQKDSIIRKSLRSVQ